MTKTKPSLRAIFKDLLIYGSGDVLLKAVAFFTLPIYTRIFSPEEYGVWNFILTTVGLVSSILILGGDSAYARFFFSAKDLTEKQRVTSTWLGFLALWSAGMALLFLPFTNIFSQWTLSTSDYARLFQLALLNVPIQLINTMCGQVLRNQFQPVLYTTLNVGSALLRIGLSLVGAVVLELGLVGIFGGVLLSSIIMLPIRLWTARAMFRPLFSVHILWQLLSFGGPLVPVSMAYWIFSSSDRFVLGKLSTLEQLGLYSVAASVTSLLGLAYSALGRAWSPHAVRMYEADSERASVFFGQVMTYLLFGFGLLCVGVTTFSLEVVMILATPPFYGAAAIVGPLTLGFMAYASTQITAVGISLTKQTKYFALYSWIAALINLGLNLIFIPKWGMVAASWTTAASYIFLTIAYLFTSQRLWAIVYEKRRALIIIGLTFAFTLTAPLLPELELSANLGIKSVYCVLYIAFLWLFQALDQREWRMLTSFRQGLPNFISSKP